MSERATPPDPAADAAPWDLASAAWSPRRVVLVALVVLRRALANFLDDRASQLAAGVSYFALISLFPIALLAFSVFGVVLRDEELQRRVLDGLVEGIPVDAPIVEEALAALASGGPTISVVALVGTIWTGSALAASLRNALNVAFDVDQRRPFVQGKLVDFTIAPGLGLLLLASLTLTTGWRFAQSEAVSLGILRDQPLVWELGAVGITGLVSFFAFLFLYWLLPNAGLRPRDLWPGALLAAVGFEAVKFGFVFYLANFSSYDVIYGSLGGVITMLIWVYVSANIMLYGAEVSAEVPRVLSGQARHGYAEARDVSWRESAFRLLRGLFLGPVEERPEPRRWASPPEVPRGED